MIPQRYAHFVFAIIQSGITTALASAVGTLQMARGDALVLHWLIAWLVSWLTVAPIVLLLAPLIQRLTTRLTR